MEAKKKVILLDKYGNAFVNVSFNKSQLEILKYLKYSELHEGFNFVVVEDNAEWEEI